MTLRGKERCWLRLFAVAALLMAKAAFAQPLLQITSPAPNTVVTPGQTLSISVTHSPDIVQVILMGDLLSGATAPQSGANPLVFTVTIPRDKAAGIYRLGAVDVTPRSAQVNQMISVPVTLEVAPTDQTSIGTDPAVELSFVGDSYTLHAFARTSSGSAIEINASPEVSWTSADPSIARVDNNGTVTGMNSGSTTVQLQYKGLSASVSVTVPSLVRGDLDGNGRVDIDDLNILNMALNTPANGPHDARDLNHDGKIDALDARILTTLCTYPRCATNP